VREDDGELGSNCCKQAWVLKNSVIGMSFWLRVSLLPSFFFLTSTKWWLPPWVLSVG